MAKSLLQLFLFSFKYIHVCLGRVNVHVSIVAHAVQIRNKVPFRQSLTLNNHTYQSEQVKSKLPHSLHVAFLLLSEANMWKY